jgi:hypothetical protein
MWREVGTIVFHYSPFAFLEELTAESQYPEARE